MDMLFFMLLLNHITMIRFNNNNGITLPVRIYIGFASAISNIGVLNAV